MTDSAPRTTLLDELDARQNEVLDQLDELDVRLQSLLNDNARSVVDSGETYNFSENKESGDQ